MQNKYVLIALVVGIIIIGLSWKTLSSFGSNISSGSEVISLTTNPNPLQMGSAIFIIDIKDKTGKPVDNATVFFDLNMTAMNMGTQQGNATPQGNGRYAASGRMSMRGPWKVSARVTMPDKSIVNKDFTVTVP